MSKEKTSVSATKISEVDFDRLWRDRVSQEISYQRQWVQEYGFMVDDATRLRLQEGNASLSSTSTSASSNPSDVPTINTYVGLKSTAHASYSVRESPEIKGDCSPFRRRKHPL